MRMKYLFAGLFLLIASGVTYWVIPYKECVPQNREIALTLDDLPLEQVFFEKIMHALIGHKAPAIGFMIGNQVNERYSPYLQEFLNAGFLLGRHSYSHLNLKKTSAELYIADLDHADKILTPLMTGTKYFRYPYLSEGKWGTRQKVLNYLTTHHYTVAPVTIDSRDFVFNLEFIQHPDRYNPEFLRQLKQRYLNFVWEQTQKVERSQHCNSTKQILLLHANALNSLFLNDLLKMYEEHGYRFITLNEAITSNTPS